MSAAKNVLFDILCLAGMLTGLPLLGIWLAGLPLEPYFEFPPQTRFVQHAPFSWTAFCWYSALIAAVIFTVALRALRAYRRNLPLAVNGTHPFPGWGWVAVAAGAAAWVLAWTRFPWMAAFQPHTFTPLWLAYIAGVNALCRRRTGRSLLTHRPLYFLSLFPASALFWWFFEYLNRFVQNWTGPISAALAALVCGFLWEMWNFYSLAKWKYSIPFVHRFEVFEMPLLGYAGYLPFGLECAVIAGLLESMAEGERPPFFTVPVTRHR